MATKPVKTAPITQTGPEHEASWEHIYAIDIGAGCGATLVACVSGTIHWLPKSAEWWAGSHSFYIKGDDGKYYLYAHCQQRHADGETVVEGEAIGEVGNEGNSTGCHLHFSVCNTYSEVLSSGTHTGDLTTYFWNHAKEPIGGQTGSGATGSGDHNSNPTHKPFVPKPPDYIFDFIPTDVIFRDGVNHTYVASIKATPIADGYSITFNGLTTWSFSYNNLILVNKHGNWLHFVPLPNHITASAGKSISIDWDIKLQKTDSTHSLLAKTGENVKILNFMVNDDQTGLGHELAKNSGWTLTNGKLHGNVKTSANQLKHNDNLYVEKPTASTDISYIPTLYSSE